MDFLRGIFHKLIRLVLGPSQFEFWQRRGYHVTPVNELQPIPDTSALAAAIWSSPSDLVGIDMNEAAQLALLTEMEGCSAEYSSLPARSTTPGEFYLDNPAFPVVDAKVLYSLIRRYRPRRIREVGAGFSTLLMAQAVRRNQAEDPDLACDYIAIDPHPPSFLSAGIPGLSLLISRPVQVVPLEQFTCLAERDILFIDSSHVLKTGSDVQRLYLDILPRLRPGVLVHVHDIFLPFDYPRGWVVEDHRFWNEQYLLQAFLIGNQSFEVVWASSYLRARQAERIKRTFGSTDGGSFWLRRRGPNPQDRSEAVDSRDLRPRLSRA